MVPSPAPKPHALHSIKEIRTLGHEELVQQTSGSASRSQPMTSHTHGSGWLGKRCSSTKRLPLHAPFKCSKRTQPKWSQQKGECSTTLPPKRPTAQPTVRSWAPGSGVPGHRRTRRVEDTAPPKRLHRPVPARVVHIRVHRPGSPAIDSERRACRAGRARKTSERERVPMRGGLETLLD